MLRSTPALPLACVVAFSALAAAQDKQDKPDKPQKSTEERLAELEKKLEGDTMRFFWKDGLRAESVDKRYKFKIGGRINYDGQFFDEDDDTKAAVETPTSSIADGTELRRARIELSGEVADNVEWAFGMDFGSGTTNFRGVYVGVKQLPFGNVRAGQFKEPFSLEEMTSANYTTFTERSLINSLSPNYNAGIMLWDTAASERVTWAVGAFRTGPDTGEVSKGDGEWAETARVTGLPICSDDGRSYVHVGLGYSHRTPTGDPFTISVKPEANLAPAYLTATLTADSIDLIGTELAWTQGPLTLSAEYMQSAYDAPTGVASSPTFGGYYAQASYFLTGESHPYKKSTGAFDAVKPKENAFGPQGGLGAWELATRVSNIDLVDDGTDRGQLDNLAFGVNWYLNPNTRLMVDCTLVDLDPAGAPSSGDTTILAFRVQFNY